MEYKSKNRSQTQKIAKDLSQKFKNTGGIIALMGDLGAGKTTFTQGFAKALGIKEKIISPTFVITRQHQIPNTNRFLFHIDLYRLENITSLPEIGISEFIDQKNSIVIIEWPEKILNLLPDETIKIKIEKIKNNERKIKISP